MIGIERQAFGFIRTVIGRSAKLSLNLPNERPITERDPHTVEQNRTFSSSKSNENRTEPNASRTEATQRPCTDNMESVHRSHETERQRSNSNGCSAVLGGARQILSLILGEIEQNRAEPSKDRIGYPVVLGNLRRI